MPPRAYLIGRKFGMLTVVSEAVRNSSGKIRYTCRCDCGGSRIVVGSYLLRGYIISCGCVKSNEQTILSTYSDMISRCYNHNLKCYKWYGGRGIRVCVEWLRSFALFKSWAYKTGFKEGMTIDRINNDKDYSPDNCQWVSRSVNARLAVERRKRSGRKYTKLSIEDVKFIKVFTELPARELAKLFGVHTNMIYHIRTGAAWNDD